MIFFFTIPFSTFAETPFKDIQHHWAKEEIEQAITEGWVDGYPDGNFRPDHYVTRAELVKMMTLANQIYFGQASTVAEFLMKPQLPANFKDSLNHWVWKQEFLQPAISWGVIVPDDYGGGFQPEHYASRREVSVMAVRTMGEVFEALNKTAALPFTDSAKIPKWLRGYVNVVSDADVVKGYPNGQFAEGKIATRAETVAIILRQLGYNRRGVAKDIKLEVLGGQKDLPVAAVTPKVSLQIVDNTLYVPLRNVFFDEKTWNWQPIQQKMYFDYDVQFGYTAGSNEYFFYGSKAGGLLQPVRMLNGELMLPVYHFEKGRLEPGIFHFDASWNNDTRTIRVKPLFVPPPIS